MGGYGFYVWGSYAVTFVLLAIEVVMVIKRKRATTRNARVTEASSTREAQNSKLCSLAQHLINTAMSAVITKPGLGKRLPLIESAHNHRAKATVLVMRAGSR